MIWTETIQTLKADPHYGWGIRISAVRWENVPVMLIVKPIAEE